MCNVFWDHQQVRDSFVCRVENICESDTVASHCKIVRHHCDDVWVPVRPSCSGWRWGVLPCPPPPCPPPCPPPPLSPPPPPLFGGWAAIVHSAGYLRCNWAGGEQSWEFDLHQGILCCPRVPKLVFVGRVLIVQRGACCVIEIFDLCLRPGVALGYDKWDRVASIATVADNPDAFSLYVDGEARESKNLAH